jgi:hypothetical protein
MIDGDTSGEERRISSEESEAVLERESFGAPAKRIPVQFSRKLASLPQSR